MAEIKATQNESKIDQISKICFNCTKIKEKALINIYKLNILKAVWLFLEMTSHSVLSLPPLYLPPQ